MKKISLFLLLLTFSLPTISQNQFAFDLYTTMDNDNNVLFSPTCIKSAFALAYEGANGKTQKEFEKVFNFKENNVAFKSEIEQLKEVSEINNSIWILENYKILPTYIQAIDTGYHTSPYYTDFTNKPIASANKINTWIEESTNGMIKNMVKPADVVNLQLALINTIYFKQDWSISFDPKKTKIDRFTNYEGSIVKVDMMNSDNDYNAHATDNEKIIVLPYKNNKASMVIVLPNEMKNYKMTHAKYDELLSKLRIHKVDLDLPKFTFETSLFELSPYLKELGLISAFEDYADFSGIREEKDLNISCAAHKAKIIVNEEGTEAAAVTLLGFVTTSVPTPPPNMSFIADKPFYYFIKDNRTNTILFMGKMNEM